MSSRRRAFLGVLAVGAIGVVAGLWPAIRQRVRCEVLLWELEHGKSPEVERELADPRYAPRVHARLLAAPSERVAAPLLALALVGKLDGNARRDLFEYLFPARFAEGTPPQPRRALDFGQRLTLAADGVVCQLVSAVPWQKGEHVYRLKAPGERGGITQFLEYFLKGHGAEAMLVYARCAWVISPPEAKTLADRFRVEVEDLTAVPDPLNLFLGRPRTLVEPGGESAVELRMASMGNWRDFLPGQGIFERSISYAVHLDRSGPEGGGREPLHLATIAVCADTALGRWFSEDAIAGKPIDRFDLGAHWLAVRVPASAAKLAPFQRIRLLFRAAPRFAESHGFRAPAIDSPPFERMHYVPPFTREDP